MIKQVLRIALVQLEVGLDKTKNINEAVKQIYKAKEKGAHVVALPECFNFPYDLKYFIKYAEPVPSGETSRVLAKAAADTGLCVVGGTHAELSGTKIYNTCTVWDGNGKLLARHRKAHMFDIDIPGKITFKESEVLSEGNDVTTFEYLGVKIGIGICYDLRFYEMAHVMASQGCSILLYPAAFNLTVGPKYWELLGRGRAHDLQLYVGLISPARDTTASYICYGHTMMLDPWGTVIGKLDEKSGVLLADIDLSLINKARKQMPIRSQRRTDIYDTIFKSN